MPKTESNLEIDDLLLVNRGVDSYNVTIDSAADKVIELMVLFEAQKGPTDYNPTTGSDTTWNIGQMWFNTTNNLMYVYYNGIWNSVGGADVTDSPITTPQKGDLWLNEDTQELSVRDKLNSKWVGVPFISGLDHLPV